MARSSPQGGSPKHKASEYRRSVPDFLFVDRDGREVGLIRGTYAEWRVGQVVERPSGRYRVLEIIFPVLPDVDENVDAYVLVEPEQ